MRRQIFRFLTPLLLLLLAGCAGKGAPVHSGVPCQDVLTLPQDLAVYAVSSGNERMLATPSEQDMASQRQKHSLFRPWRMTKASVWVKQSLDKNFNMRPEKGFAGDERPFPADLWRELEANSNKEGYPSREGPAITLRHTSLRAMPTRERYYLNPDLPGEGYPFDYFQLSSIPVGAPLYICNVSRDGQWLLVESSITAGWLPAADAAPVDEVFMERWQDLPLAALVKDGVMIGGDAAHIGTLLPLPGPAPQGRGHALSVYYPAREGSGPAVMAVANLPPDSAVTVPLHLNPAEVARVGNEMMGQSYGWGGLDGKRDCSALTRDLLAPFGLYLPRNSTTQSKAGRVINLGGLPGQEKENVIASNALPFSSLIWMRGHIGLYLGQYDGKAVMFHNMWGLKTRDAQGGCDGRAIVGKAVVTTLRPGVERPDLCVPGSFLERIECVTTLPANAGPQ